MDRYRVNDPTPKAIKTLGAKISLGTAISALVTIIYALAKSILPKFVLRSTKDPVFLWTLLANYVLEEEGNVELSRSLFSLKSVRNSYFHGNGINTIDLQLFYIHIHRIYQHIELSSYYDQIYRDIMRKIDRIIIDLNIVPSDEVMNAKVENISEPVRAQDWYVPIEGLKEFSLQEPPRSTASPPRASALSSPPRATTSPPRATTSPPRTSAITSPPRTSAITSPPRATTSPSRASALSSPPRASALSSPPRASAMFSPPRASAMFSLPRATTLPPRTSAITSPPRAATSQAPPRAATSQAPPRAATSQAPPRATTSQAPPHITLSMNPKATFVPSSNRESYDYSAIGKIMTLRQIKEKYGRGAKGILVQPMEGMHVGRTGAIGKFNGANIYLNFSSDGDSSAKRAVGADKLVKILSAPILE